MFLLSMALPVFSLGAARAEETHKLVATAGKAPVGQATTVAVTVEGRNGWHINAEAPISMKLMPSEGVLVAKEKMARTDLAESTENRARFDVTATCNEPGTRTIAAEANFVMCQETACKPVREKITLTVTAEPAAAKPAAKRKKS